MKFSTQTAIILSIFGAASAYCNNDEYKPVLCSGDFAGLYEYRNICRAEEDGINPKDCQCNEAVALMDLMDKRFGKSNCGKVNRSPHELGGPFYECKDPVHRITATFNVFDYSTSIPNDMTFEDKDGEIDTIFFVNRCTDHDDLAEFMTEYFEDDKVVCPAVYEPVVCSGKIFDNHCMAEISDEVRDADKECTCFETEEIIDLMKDKFDSSNCFYEESDVYVCRTVQGEPAASLYLKVDGKIMMPDTMQFSKTGQSNTDMEFFSRQCKDFQTAVFFLEHQGM